MHVKNVAVCSLLVTLLSAGLSFAGSEIITLQPRPNVKLKVLVIEPEKPSAVLVLYAGGVGTLDLSSTFGIINIGKYTGNFLVRVREKFIEKGFVVALPDVPSDRQAAEPSYRTSQEQISDLIGVTSYMKNRYSIPIWVIGTSWSSYTVAMAGISEKIEIDGLVFSSSETRPRRDDPIKAQYPWGVISMDLPKIKVPTLLVSHKEDRCNGSPAEDVETFAQRFTSASKVEIKFYNGGSKPTSGPCEPFSQHGFLGIEDQVVNDIVAFINAQ
jgi:hypothetical protein